MVISGLLVFGCASRDPDPNQYSGYLKDYSQLEQSKDAMGVPVLRFIGPKLNPDNYQKVIIEPVQYYPDPKPTEYINAGTLQMIKEYIDQMFRMEVEKKIPVVEQPGPGTARIRVALTAVGKGTESLKPYQYIPQALIITGAMAAVKGRPEEAKLYLEAEMTDSFTGERLGIAVRQGSGERLRKAKDNIEREVTLDALIPLLDR